MKIYFLSELNDRVIYFVDVVVLYNYYNEYFLIGSRNKENFKIYLEIFIYIIFIYKSGYLIKWFIDQYIYC